MYFITLLSKVLRVFIRLKLERWKIHQQSNNIINTVTIRLAFWESLSKKKILYWYFFYKGYSVLCK